MQICHYILNHVLWQRPSGDVIEQAKQRIQEIQVTLDSAADEERRRNEDERKKRSGLFWGYLVVVVFPQVNWPLKRNMPCGNQTWQ
jgi:hypothetical protein